MSRMQLVAQPTQIMTLQQIQPSAHTIVHAITLVTLPTFPIRHSSRFRVKTWCHSLRRMPTMAHTVVKTFKSWPVAKPLLLLLLILVPIPIVKVVAR